MTTPRLIPLRRMTLAEPAADQACTQTTFRASLDHTESAAMAFDAEDPRPLLGRDYSMGHAHGYIDGLRACGQRTPGLVLYLAGALTGAAVALLWGVFA